jgi:DNA recombination protein RmuC
MSQIMLIVTIALLSAVVALQVAQLFRRAQIDLSPVQQAIQSVEKAHERAERAVREEIAKNREELANAARRSREEMGNTLKGIGDSLNKLLGAVRETVEKRLGALQEANAKKLDEIRLESGASAQKTRQEVSKVITDFVSWQRGQFASVVDQLKTLTDSNEKRLDTVRTTLEQRLKTMQEENATNLEKMRQTVDEKLQGTLEKRLGESFKLVSERLEAVSKGLGEMQSLATGVGDLKRVLTNVKARGTWGEVQLERMLEEILAPDQYGKNVSTGDNRETVEFAIRLPGHGEDKDDIVLLPIDAKFPLEDYQRLVDAQELGNGEAAEAASKQLEVRIKGCASNICSKYLNPPKTTDFGILFLPTEGLFAEVIRRPGLAETIQRTQHVVIAGPTTLWSILNSFQMGFRILAIQQHSGEVWNLLAAVKTEFGKYGEVMDKVRKKLVEATNHVESIGTRSRAIERKLKNVGELPVGEAQKVLMLEGVDGEVESDSENGQ